ncbi:hypothetical protein BHE74_00055534 [Ensete ventricosum]|nr:hypothetical protein GW17_00059023 [Ensete ventricosum]RWW39160.1 hypothetical protein BHE74_00055534 [Ensete ventricosum]RZS13752.1 hypothetical protein BHM03_00045381 [Ensete ventricosum]
MSTTNVSAMIESTPALGSNYFLVSSKRRGISFGIGDAWGARHYCFENKERESSGPHRIHRSISLYGAGCGKHYK